MEEITIGQISSIVLFLGGFIGGISILLNYIKKWMKTLFKGELNDLKQSINSLKLEVDKLGVSDCKNFLISCFAKLESGQELDETEKQRFDEVYDIYTNTYHKNSYIHNKYEKLKKEGKI